MRTAKLVSPGDYLTVSPRKLETKTKVLDSLEVVEDAAADDDLDELLATPPATPVAEAPVDLAALKAAWAQLKAFKPSSRKAGEDVKDGELQEDGRRLPGEVQRGRRGRDLCGIREGD